MLAAGCLSSYTPPGGGGGDQSGGGATGGGGGGSSGGGTQPADPAPPGVPTFYGELPKADELALAAIVE